MKLKCLIDYIRSLFILHCPDCDGEMESEFFDMSIDKMVYKCKQCGKEWV